MATPEHEVVWLGVSVRQTEELFVSAVLERLDDLDDVLVHLLHVARVQPHVGVGVLHVVQVGPVICHAWYKSVNTLTSVFILQIKLVKIKL